MSHLAGGAACLGHVSEGARKGAGSRAVAPVGSADDDDIPRLPPEPIHTCEHLVERLLDLLSVTARLGRRSERLGSTSSREAAEVGM